LICFDGTFIYDTWFLISLIQVKVQMDDFRKLANDRMIRLNNLDAWEETDPTSDDLAADEKLVKMTESALDDNVDDGIENISVGDEISESQNFELEDMLSVAAE
jgi:hypothetical protein